eukprot:UN03800
MASLHYENCEDLIQILVENGADPTMTYSFRGRESLSLVDIAMNMKRSDVVKQLMQAGALPTKNSAVRFDMTLLQFAN